MRGGGWGGGGWGGGCNTVPTPTARTFPLHTPPGPAQADNLRSVALRVLRCAAVLLARPPSPAESARAPTAPRRAARRSQPETATVPVTVASQCEFRLGLGPKNRLPVWISKRHFKYRLPAHCDMDPGPALTLPGALNLTLPVPQRALHLTSARRRRSCPCSLDSLPPPTSIEARVPWRHSEAEERATWERSQREMCHVALCRQRRPSLQRTSTKSRRCNVQLQARADPKVNSSRSLMVALAAP